MDDAQRFHQVGAGAAAGIEHVDVLIRETVGDTQFITQHRIHPRHHVADDFFRRVPDAQFAAQFRIEGFKERLVEILHGVLFLKAPEEFLRHDAVQRLRCPIQRLFQAQGL